MDVRTCGQCKRLFNYLAGSPICVQCREKLEEKFLEVKEYVREHPGEGITEVAHATEVSVKQIRRWIREERLAFSEDSNVGIDCESCGRTIKSGRLCKDCKDKLIGAVDSMYAVNNDSVVAKRQREAAKMRYIRQFGDDEE